VGWESRWSSLKTFACDHNKVQALKILVADDDPVTRTLLENHLRQWGHEVVAAEDGESAWQELIKDDPPKIAILDWMMPKRDGLDICTALRESEQDSYVYIIFLTSRSAKEDVVKGLDAGADDYIVKPFDYNELRTRVRAGARIVKLQDELRAALKVSEFRATHDSLTGLLNRPAILEVLGKELSRARRTQTPLSVVMADIDHFKQINDVYGHAAGDQVLRQAAQRITSSIRQYDHCGRYGGEEFLVVLPGCDRSSARDIAERLRHNVCKSDIPIEDKAVRVTLSLGLAEYRQGQDVDALIKEADAALYRAKQQGRNRVEE
jgi:diguanylate cyclase (GGDEF)-like protein